ncbi:hypothetical protein HY522_07115 [bacterium]|nr:hypothetical protein [bacterium]
MSPNDKWRAVLEEALAIAATERPNEPCLGTRFRQLVDAVAAKHGACFPPAEEPTLRFIQLLERYPEILIVRRRGGQDVLVAPTNKPELFAESSKWPAPGIRQDLFNAFVRISDDRAWYDRDRDVIIWTEANTTPTVSESLIPIPLATLDDAVAVRRAFAETLPPPVRADVEATLATARPLTLFTGIVRSRGLGLQWHVFRTKELVERIGVWARNAGLVWRDEWMTAVPSSLANMTKAHEAAATDQRDWRAALIVMAEHLDEQDLARISVPLDVVLRMLAPRP